jgi:hypothetical protein
MLKANAIHRGLDGAVEKLHNEDQQHRADQQRFFYAGSTQPQPTDNDRHGDQEFLSKSGLILEGSPDAPVAGRKGINYAVPTAQLRSFHCRQV